MSCSETVADHLVGRCRRRDEASSADNGCKISCMYVTRGVRHIESSAFLGQAAGGTPAARASTEPGAAASEKLNVEPARCPVIQMRPRCAPTTRRPRWSPSPSLCRPSRTCGPLRSSGHCAVRGRGRVPRSAVASAFTRSATFPTSEIACRGVRGPASGSPGRPGSRARPARAGARDGCVPLAQRRARPRRTRAARWSGR